MANSYRGHIAGVQILFVGGVARNTSGKRPVAMCSTQKVGALSAEALNALPSRPCGPSPRNGVGIVCPLNISTRTPRSCGNANRVTCGKPDQLSFNKVAGVPSVLLRRDLARDAITFAQCKFSRKIAAECAYRPNMSGAQINCAGVARTVTSGRRRRIRFSEAVGVLVAHLGTESVCVAACSRRCLTPNFPR